MGVKLVSASAGSVELVAPVTASNYTATMPAGTGSVVVNGVNSAIVSSTAQASTSGTSIDFTGIPSWVKRITVVFNGVSTNGTSGRLVQIGAGSVTSSGYSSTSCGVSTAASIQVSSSGYAVYGTSSPEATSCILSIVNVSGNIWVSSHSGQGNASSYSIFGGGVVTLSGTLDRVRVTTANGTDTFDAGSINILYE
jgi:hypothetical protein